MAGDPLSDARLLTVEAYLDEGKLEDAQRALALIGHEASLEAGVSYLAARLLFLRGRLDRGGLIQRLRDLVVMHSGFPQATRLLEELEPSRVAEEPGKEAAPEPGPATPPPPGPEPVATAPELESRLSSIPALPSRPPFTPPPSSAVAPGASAPVLELGSVSLPTRELEPSNAPDKSAPTLPFASGSSAPPFKANTTPAVKMAAIMEAPRASAIPRAPGVPRFSPPPDREPSYAPEALRKNTPDEALVPEIPLPDLDLVPSDAPRERIRSGVPPPHELGALPPVIDLLEMLERGQYRRVINSIDFAGFELSPEHVLIRARALIGEGQLEDGQAELERLCDAPLLDPDLRAGCARVLLELGKLEAALGQARLAASDDPGPPMIRVTLAWVALRSARREGDPALVGEADEMLAGVEPRGGPRPALVAALRACVEAEIGDPEHAITSAQRALALDPHSADALAALALASARLDRAHDTAQAWLRLLEESYVEADALSDRIERLGIDLSELNPAERTAAADAARSLWEPMEIALAEGRPEDAAVAFETEARARFDKLTERGAHTDLPIVATVAANLLTTAVPWRDFAPWDLSLRSIARVQASLDLLYGRGPRPEYDSDDFPAQLLVGAYLGEVLRQAHGARWEGSVLVAEQACVVGRDNKWWPFVRVKERIREGAPLALEPDDAADTRHHIPNPLPPPCPWGSAPWPRAGQMRGLGRGLAKSAIGVWCERNAEGMLDRSIASVASLDMYLELVAPPGAPATGGDAWARRLAILLGAYLGEVICETLGGVWGPDAPAACPDDYRVLLDDLEAAPVEHVLGRIVGHTPASLSEYVTRLAHKLGH